MKMFVCLFSIRFIISTWTVTAEQIQKCVAFNVVSIYTQILKCEISDSVV